MKIKKFIKRSIIALVAVFSSAIFSLSSLSINTAKAATVPDNYGTKTDVSQSISYNVDNLSQMTTNSIKTINLYGDELVDKNYTITRSFSGFKNAGIVNNINQSANELVYYAINTSKTAPANAQFYSTITLSDNIKTAMNNGYVSVSASSYFGSKEKYGVGGFLYGDKNSWGISLLEKMHGADRAENVKMELYVFNDESVVNGYASTEAKRNGYAISKDVLSLAADSLKGNNSNQIRLYFSSTYNGETATSNAATTCNYMGIKEPSVTFTTTDKTAPTITFDDGTDISTEQPWTTEPRVLNFVVSDAESGIQAVYLNGELVENLSLNANTTEATFEHTISARGSYEIKMVDNVGNETTQTYVESKFDDEAPEFTTLTDMNEFYSSKTITLDTVVNRSLFNAENDVMYYSYTSDNCNAYDVQILENTTVIVVPENATYVFKFYGEDQAGNTFEKVFANVVIDDRTVVVLDVKTQYTYNKNGFTPEFVADVTGEYQVNFVYYDETGVEITASEVKNVGQYKLVYNISNSLYVGSCEPIDFEIVKRQVTITNLTKEYFYSGNELDLIFEIDYEIDLAYEFSGTGSLFVDAGNYHVVITPEDDHNYTLLFEDDIVVKPFEIEISNVKNSFTFDNEIHQILFDANVSDEVKKLITISYFDGLELVENPKEAKTYTAIFAFAGSLTNYVFDYATTEETAQSLIINKREIEVCAGSVAIVYGSPIPAIEYIIENGIDSQALQFDLVCEAFNLSEPSVGDYVVSFKQSNDNLLSNEEKEILGNYNINFVNGLVSISKKDVVIYPNQKQFKIYGDEEKTIGYTTIGLAYNDVLEGALSRVQGENVGYYNITIGTISSGNYNITLSDSTFEIIKRSCYIIVNSYSKVYGEADPTFEFDARNTNILEQDLSLFSNSELFSREENENVGKYAIEFDSSNDAFANYNVIAVSGVLKIQKKAITISANEIFAVYGTSEELTYSVDGLVGEDSIEIVLERESGSVVADYAIKLKTTKFDNYYVDKFEGSIYHIVKNRISITAENSEKTYGEADPVLTYVVSGLLDGDKLTGSLERVQGENVGTYAIKLGTLSNENYYIENFVEANLVINKAPINVVINNASKVYGEVEENLNFALTGLKFNDELDINLIREVGEDAGLYAITLGENEFANYYVNEVTNGIFEIEKANLTITLQDKFVVYNANQVVIDAPEFPFELTYEYTWMGSEIEGGYPVDAGVYAVQAKFAGNDNYNACVSNEATITIEKKFIPVVIKQTTFVYNGKGQMPEYEIAIDLTESVPVSIEFEDGIDPVEIGEYDFEFQIIGSQNYKCDAKGTLKIVDEFYVSGVDSNASVSSTNVNFSDSSVNIFMNNSSNLLKKFNALFDGKQCVAVYEISSTSANENGVFVIKVKALEGNPDVEIYSLDADGNMIKTAFAYENGYYTLALDSLASQILVAKTNNLMFYAKIVAMTTVVMLSIAVTKILNRRRLNKFFKKNTFVKLFDAEVCKKSVNLVQEKVLVESNVSARDFLNTKS